MSDKTEDQLRREALMGAVDEDGDIVWFFSPRSLGYRKRSAGDAQTSPSSRTGDPDAEDGERGK